MSDPVEAQTTIEGSGGPQHPAPSEGALKAAREALAGLPEPIGATLRGLVDDALIGDSIIRERDIVIILGAHWNGCLVLVTEVKTWGIQGFVRLPMQGDAYIRVSNNDFAKVGRLPDDIGPEDE